METLTCQSPGDSANDLAIFRIDPWVEPFRSDIELRMQRYSEVRAALLKNCDSLADFANGHHYFGFHQTEDGWYYREWAPAAEALYLIGDFNFWNRGANPLRRLEDGVWEIFLPGREALKHRQHVKVHVVSQGTGRDRIPLYIHKVAQDPNTHDFTGVIWQPEKQFEWTDADFLVDRTKAPLIYETHIGMAQETEGIGSYLEFAETMLPRIKLAGYNTIQIMAIMEHPYYASFGYHVSNYFAASAWFGNPDDLKFLINKAHSMGLTVLMDIVQSHAVKNLSEGISAFDGTDEQFFHSGERGYHSAWDSRVFNYGKHEVIHFLLSSVKYWLEEFHFDGFRFDGVTSMIYLDHGLGTAFDNYAKYFSLNTDVEALTYLQLVNELIQEMRPDALSIAEDMSGMPGMCLPIAAGGIGFDFRLAMGMPDFWIKTVQKNDHDWNMSELWHELTTSRPCEKRIGYVESHDQALVGDKTFIFWLADKEMYWHMDRKSDSMVIARAIALHKMARLATISLGCEGYLNFMGNEFGHPEWIDFPRAGNNWSFWHCRRQWSLVEDPLLRYSDLNTFDREMLSFIAGGMLLGDTAQQLWLDQERKLVAYRKKDFVFLLNFHPTASYADFSLPLHVQGKYKVVFDTDRSVFGGQDRIDNTYVYETIKLPQINNADGIRIYSPSRTALVLQRIGESAK